MQVSLINRLPSITISWDDVIPYRALSKRIEVLISQQFKGNLTPDDVTDLKRTIKLSRSWTWPSSQMKELLSKLSPELVEAFMLQIMESGNTKEVDYYFNCLDSLNEQVLLSISNFKTIDVAADSFSLYGHTKATALAHGMEKEIRVILKEFLMELEQFLHQFLDILISLSGINDAFRDNGDGRWRDDGRMDVYEAKSKLKAYGKLLALPAALFAVIYSHIKLTAPSLILTSATVVSVLTALVAYQRYWKPCPTECEGLTNMNIEVLNKKDPIYVRQEPLNEIEAAFKANKCVILVGEHGCGKTSIAESLVQESLEGRSCTFIKKPRFFKCPTLVSNGIFGGSPLSYLTARFKKHRTDVIFYVDEIAASFKPTGLQGESLGDEIKPFAETFRVIGSTTIEEYEKYIKDKPAISGRRFVIIFVKGMTTDQIKTSLAQRLGSTNSKIAFDPEVIAHIIAQSKVFNPDTSVIDASQSLLTAAIEKMKSTEQVSLKRKIAVLEDELAALEHKAISGKKQEGLSERTTELKTTKEKIEEMKKEFVEIEQKIEKMLSLEASVAKLEKQAYLLSNPDTDLVHGSTQEREWLKLHSRINLTSKFVANARRRLGFPEILDAKVIDTVIKEAKRL